VTITLPQKKIGIGCSKRTRGVKPWFLFILLASLLTNLAYAAPAQKKEQELKALRGRIEQTQKDLESAEESKSETTDALKSSERSISQTNRELYNLSLQQHAVSAKLNALQSDATRTQREIDQQQALLSKLLYQRYLAGEDDPLKLLLNQKNPNEAARQLHYYTYLSRARADLIQSQQRSLEHLQALANETQEKNQELTRIKTAQESHKHQLEVEQNARKLVLARIARQIQNRQRELSTLKRDEQRLTQLIERLTRIVAKKHKHPAPATPGSVKQPDLSRSSGVFRQLKGKLGLPVAGEVTHRFGSPREDSGALWKGIFVRAHTGEAIKAVAAGRVVFADWLRGFGNLLIIDHDDGFMSLYGNNEALYKQVGETVHGGDIISTAGNSGGSPDSGLYFELRYQSRPFDPLSWTAR
jgi:septal ring factor EnvC (AmiA/AmiB activator)